MWNHGTNISHKHDTKEFIGSTYLPLMTNQFCILTLYTFFYHDYGNIWYVLRIMTLGKDSSFVWTCLNIKWYVWIDLNL